MIELIRQHASAAAEAGDWEEVAAILNALTVEVSDAQPWTYGKIGERLGTQAQLAAADFLRPLAAGNGRLQDAHQLLLLGDGVRTGLRLDLEDRQQELSELQVAFPAAAPLLSAIAQLGRTVRSLVPEVVTAVQCESVWTTDAAAQARSDFLRDVYNAAWNTHLAPVLDSNDPLTRESVAAALEAMAAQVRGV